LSNGQLTTDYGQLTKVGQVMASATYSELLKRNVNFRRLWVGQVISELGSWFSFIAELGLVRLVSGSPLATTALLVARLLPFLLVAPLAGVFVDRRSRKRMMIAADLLRALVALGYLLVGLRGPVWIVYVCGAAMSSFSMFFEAAKNAALPNLVTPRELLTANVMMFSTRFLQLTLGAALGGLTAARFGYDVAFIVNSLSFVASAIYVTLIPAAAMRSPSAESAAEAERERQSQTGEEPLADPMSADAPGGMPIAGSEHAIEQSPGRFFSDLREGLAYAWATPFVRGLILVNIGWATGGGMINLLYDRIGGHVFTHGQGDRGDWGVATLYTAAGAGLFVGMMLARRAGAWASDERRAGRFIGWSFFAHGLCFAVAGLMPSLTLMASWVVISRLIIGMEFGVQETLMMRMLPDDYRGRVFTTDRSLEMTTMMLSMIAGGYLLRWFSPRAMMVASGLLSASPGLAWLLAMWLKRVSVPARAVRESFSQ